MAGLSLISIPITLASLASTPNISAYPAFEVLCDDYLHHAQARASGISGVRFDDMDSDTMCGLLRHVIGGAELSEDTIVRLSFEESAFDPPPGSRKPLSAVICNDFRERRMHGPTMPSERRWRLLRRGRAIEFNLVIDRRTIFGLAASGVRAESALVGIPPEAKDLGAKDQDTEEVEMVKALS